MLNKNSNKGMGTIAIILIFLVLLVMALSFALGRATHNNLSITSLPENPIVQQKNILETTIAEMFRGLMVIPQ